MNRAEFAADRSSTADRVDAILDPIIRKAIQNFPDTGWYDPIIAAVRQIVIDVYHHEGGEGTPRIPKYFLDSLRATLDKTTHPDSITVARLVPWLSTASINEGTQLAGAVGIDYEWVTMHDTSVREAHKNADGQTRSRGQKFLVGGVRMSYPGDPRAPIELWINCRCMLRPVQEQAVAAATEDPDAFSIVESEGVVMTQTETEQPVEAPGLLPWHGILAPEGVQSGDGRTFEPGSLSTRDLPLPLTWQKTSAAGHDGSVTVGDISEVKMIDGMMHASGVFLMTPEADEAVGLLAHFGKFGVSVDADSAEFDFNEEDGNVNFTKARVCSASMVSIPAFAEAYISLGNWDAEHAWNTADSIAAAAVNAGRGPGWITNPKETKRLHDYWTRPGEPGFLKVAWGTEGDYNRCLTELGSEIAESSPDKVRFLHQICAQWQHDAIGIWPGKGEKAGLQQGTPAPAVSLVAAVESIKAPAAWFTDPNLDKPTHLTVTEEGRVFGHIAWWSSCHIGFEKMCVAPPSSASDYAYYANKCTLLDNGLSARTGPITTGGGHAGPNLRANAAVAHYDSTSTVVADVCVGEDVHGIWCAGWVRPGTSPEQVVALRASDVSGDWRNIGGQMEMIAVLGVNSGGFKIAAAVENGVQMSLVAAGVVTEDHEEKPDLSDFGEAVAAAIEARAKRREAAAVLLARFGADA